MRIVFRYGDGPAPGSEHLEPGEAVWDDTNRRLGIGIGGQTPRWYPGFDSDGNLRMNTGQTLGAQNTPGTIEWTTVGVSLRRDGVHVLKADGVASATNYAVVTNAVTSANPILSAAGTDTNVGLDITTKGSGEHRLRTGGGTQLAIGHTANAVNFVKIFGGASNAPASIKADGDSAAIDIEIVPKGGGYLRFGGWSIEASPTINGYVTIKDSNGNVRKLATLA